jgi:hypothetical protein
MLYPRFLRLPPALLLGFYCVVACCVSPTQADTTEAKKRALLAPVKRVAVLPPYFGTDTLAKAAKLGEPKPGEEPVREPAQEEKTEKEKTENRRDQRAAQPPPPGAENLKLGLYAGYLRKLQDDAQHYLPQRVAKRAGFEVIPEEEVRAALKTLQRTPEKMFQNDGRIKGSKFPLPLPDAVRDLAKALHADAVVLGVLDEPRRANGKYLFDPLYGLSYESGYVEAHGGFYLMLADGTEALHGYMRVRNPVSRAGGRQFVLPDWIDAQELMIENLMDEWTYYTPKK